MTLPVPSDAPVVGIIIPCYNVEAYLDDCVRSAVNQTYAGLKIVLVDDGSEDGTPELVDAWQKLDDRVVVVHQPNAGLGAARNVGIETAGTVDYIFFLDSDDLIPLDAIERMVRSAESTESDMVSGVAHRFNSERSWKAAMYRSPFNRDRAQTHVYSESQLLYDHIACSKLFRRTFWHEHGFRFPEAVLFEDIELVTRAHCLARSVDLLSSPTYLWRDREDGDVSITQDRARPGSTKARFDALHRVDEFLRDHAPPEVWEAHGAKVCSLDIPVYCRLAADETPEYLDEFVGAGQRLAQSVSEAGVEKVRPLNRLTWQVLSDGDPQMVLACARVLSARSKNSLWRAVSGTRTLKQRYSAEAANAEIRSIRRRGAALVKQRVQQTSRRAASSTGDTLFRQFQRRAIRPDGAGDTDGSIDAAVEAVRKAEQTSKRLARKIGVVPKPSRAAKGNRGVDLAVLGLAGTVIARVSARPTIGHRLTFDEAPITVDAAVLIHSEERIRIDLVEDEHGYSLDVEDMQRFGTRTPLRPGTWHVVLVDTSGFAWNVAAQATVHYDRDDPCSGARYRFRANQSQITFTVASLLPVPDRGPRPQQLIRAAYSERARNGERSRAVLYECFYGRSVGCHPRAIFELLREQLPDDVEHVFVTQPGFLYPPAGATTAQRWSRRYHELMATSPLLISNCELHRTFTKSDFQTVVQTWHGTPLKRIGLDIDSPKFQNHRYQDDLAHQANQWSFMLSPTSDTDEIFRRAFGYDGLLLPSGSPRNDSVVAADPAKRAAIRRNLGLDDDTPAVLFAPTFRDDARSKAGYETSPQCDLTTLLKSMPSNTVVLFRAHSNIRTNAMPWTDSRVKNVSDYPDAQDLILGADVLVTDYSSLMFDWALSNKPIVLFAPDLEDYQGVRDFYYDYDETLTPTTARTPAQLAQRLAEALSTPEVDQAELIATFAHRDDGHATQRVVDEILNRVQFD